MRLVFASSFAKAFRKLDPQLQIEVEASLEALLEVPPPSRLHFKKLKSSRYWSARVNLNYRLVLRCEDEDYVVIDVCNHNSYERKYG